MKCLETRTRPDGIKRRRYRVSPGRTVTTFEIPETVARALGITRLKQAMAAHQRGEASRVRAEKIKEMIKSGWKPTAVAHEMGVTEARVRQIRDQLKEN
jgi:hypothetical protein